MKLFRVVAAIAGLIAVGCSNRPSTAPDAPLFALPTASARSSDIVQQVVGAYHIDGQSHGASLGPDGTAVEQFGFIFKC
jgi:hypothetical protein